MMASVSYCEQIEPHNCHEWTREVESIRRGCYMMDYFWCPGVKRTIQLLDKLHIVRQIRDSLDKAQALAQAASIEARRTYDEAIEGGTIEKGT